VGCIVSMIHDATLAPLHTHFPPVVRSELLSGRGLSPQKQGGNEHLRNCGANGACVNCLVSITHHDPTPVRRARAHRHECCAGAYVAAVTCTASDAGSTDDRYGGARVVVAAAAACP
jgi:hypothetical protein